MRSDDYVMLTIVLEGAFVGTEHVRLPLENLTLIAGPSTSTEFRWINGKTSRRRVLTYRLRPNGAGSAAAGPVVVTAPNGDKLTLKRVSIDVVDAVQGNAALETGLSLGRLPAVMVEVSNRDALVGEQIEVKWSLYGDNIRGVQLLELPSLDGFWVEQLDTDETTREVLRVGDELVQRQTLRHVLLYPLRPGPAEIAPLVASVRVYQPDRIEGIRGWNPFGGSVTELVRQSRPVTIEVSAPPDASLPVGTFELSCTEPRVPAQGPVAVELTLRGAGNLRAVAAPELAGTLDAGVEIESLPTTIHDGAGSIVMQRRWRYLMFPRSQGPLRIPPLRFRFFDPSTRETRTASCGGWTAEVSAAEPVVAMEDAPVPEDPADDEGRSFDYWVPAVVTVVALLMLVPFLLRVVRRDGGRKQMLKLVDRPAELRKAVERWLVKRGQNPTRLKNQPGERGDAWRSLSSLLDLVEREPWELERSKPELRRRLEELLDER